MKNYKKVILTLMVAILSIGAANAQLRFGVKAGLNLNNISLTKLPTTADLAKDNQCGYTAGLMTEFQVPVIGLCFDLSLMYTYMNSDLSDKQKDMGLSKSFLELPINIKYKIGLPVVSSFLTPYIFTGPSFAFRLGKPDIKDIQATVDTKTTQTAWNVGIGVELIKHLQISGSYGFGINNAMKITGLTDKTGVALGDVKAKNNYWTVTAAWLF